jgi:KDO2-lipid IV(A) lauroyltransferase
MRRRFIKREWKYWVIYRILLKFAIWLVNVMSWGVAYAFARGMARLAWLLRLYHKTIFKNLNLAFGDEKSQEEIKSIARGVYDNLMRYSVELLRCVTLTSEDVERLFTIEGEDNLKRALAKGKGVMTISGHLGNFMLMGTKLIEKGYPLGVLYREVRDKEISRLIKDRQEKANMHSIPALPAHRAVRDSLRWLGENKLLFLQQDRNFFEDKGAIWVEFFGQPAATAPGTVTLAKRTNAVLLPLFVVQKKENEPYTIIIESPVELELTGDKKRDILVNTQKFTRIIEDYVRKYPAQYFWIYKRWRGTVRYLEELHAGGVAKEN